MTYSRHFAYRQASATGWTRVDMLLALYDATLIAVEQGQTASQAHHDKPLIEARFRTQRLIAELMSGIDPEQGQLPQNIQRLLAYCLEQICGDTEEEWAAVAAIVTSLRDSFRAIRDQAVQLEQAGQIPPLELGASDLMLAVV
ncbi:MAG: flagellar protein FliS [Planctomycetaceae bacterium]